CRQGREVRHFHGGPVAARIAVRSAAAQSTPLPARKQFPVQPPRPRHQPPPTPHPKNKAPPERAGDSRSGGGDSPPFIKWFWPGDTPALTVNLRPRPAARFARIWAGAETRLTSISGVWTLIRSATPR